MVNSMKNSNPADAADAPVQPDWNSAHGDGVAVPDNRKVSQSLDDIYTSQRHGALVRNGVIQDYPTITGVSPSSGVAAGGTAVTVTGTHLTGATAFNLGGVGTTSRVVVNATTITAVSGAHAAGVVAAAVITPGGTGNLASAFTYIALPTIPGALSPATGVAAGGTAVTITGTALTGTTGVTFGGVAATSVVVVSATSVTLVTPAHAAGAVDVVLTTPGGSVTKTGGYTYS